MQAKKKEPVRQSQDDAWWESAMLACAKEAARWLQQTINLKRPISSLTGAEMKALATAICARYSLERSKAEDAERESIRAAEAQYVLMAG